MNDEKTRTKEEYEAAVDKVRALYIKSGLSEQSRIEAYVGAVMEAYGLTVEPAPILPGVTGGKWDYRRLNDRGAYELFAKKRGSIDMDGTTGEDHIGWVSTAKDASLIAGSKDLVELVVVHIRNQQRDFGEIERYGEIVDQLEAMGAVIPDLKDGD